MSRTSSTVAWFGMLTVLLMAPLIKGWAAAIHAEMGKVVDAALPARGPEGAVEERQMLGLQVGGAFDRVLFVDVGDDRGDLLVGIAEGAVSQIFSTAEASLHVFGSLSSLGGSSGGLLKNIVSKTDASGTASWAENGIVVRTSLNLEGDLDIVSDIAGGVVFIWNEYGGNIYAQRVSASGKRLWAAPGILVSSAVRYLF